jgi:hypothetical protein
LAALIALRTLGGASGGATAEPSGISVATPGVVLVGAGVVVVPELGGGVPPLCASAGALTARAPATAPATTKDFRNLPLYRKSTSFVGLRG